MDARNALERLGWNQAELGRRIGVRPNTVSDWFKPDGPGVPGYALAYLMLALELEAVRVIASASLERTKK